MISIMVPILLMSTVVLAKPEECVTKWTPAGDGCNSCQVTICTDGKKQWEQQGAKLCTTLYCGRPALMQVCDPKIFGSACEESK